MLYCTILYCAVLQEKVDALEMERVGLQSKLRLEGEERKAAEAALQKAEARASDLRQQLQQLQDLQVQA